MTTSDKYGNRVVYVVTGWPQRMTNDRVARILKLRPGFRRMVLVVQGSEPSDDKILAVRPIPNPLGLLRRAGMRRLADTLERMLYFPNSHVLFTIVAKRKMKELVRKDLEAGREVCVLTSVPDHENTSIGLYLKERFPAIDWIIDWQDLWSYDENYFDRVFPLYRGLLKSRERKVLETADFNVTTNERARRVLNEVYGVPLTRLKAIHHHFDRDTIKDVAAPSQEREPDATSEGELIRIGFLGGLFKPPKVPGLQFMEALRQVRKSGVKVELHVHGTLPPDIGEQTDWLRESGLVMAGRVPHDQCVAALAQYDYLLVLLADLPNTRAIMNIKLPQYLLAGRPVLAVVPNSSAVADIVRQTRTGEVIASDGDWQAQLMQLLARPKGDITVSADHQAIEQFSWEQLSVLWKAVLSGESTASPESAEA